MLDWAMAIIISTATQETLYIRRYSVGRLKDKEKAEVLSKITSLVKDLTEEQRKEMYSYNAYRHRKQPNNL